LFADRLTRREWTVDGSMPGGHYLPPDAPAAIVKFFQSCK
jgi:hypothetical protein